MNFNKYVKEYLIDELGLDCQSLVTSMKIPMDFPVMMITYLDSTNSFMQYTMTRGEESGLRKSYRNILIDEIIKE